MAGSPLRRARRLAAEAAARGEVYVPPPELAARMLAPIVKAPPKVNGKADEAKQPKPKAPPKERPRPTITTDVAADIKPSPGQRIRNVQLSEEDEKNSVAVRMMVSTKTSITAMADMMGMRAEDFRRTYQKELTRGHDYVYAVISQKIVASAFAGDLRAAFKWMQQFGGWQEVTRKELTGKNGEPISIRSLDGPTLFALMDAISEKGAAGRNKGRAPPQIDYTASTTDLDAISGAADEGAEE